MKWYFDFISPYAYLQSTCLADFEKHGPVQCVPVLFAGLLNHFDNIGPAELAPKRQWTFEYVAWLAHKHGIALTMPAHHPFNPLPLLRLCVAAGSTVAVVQRIFRFVWADGFDPEDQAAFANLCTELGVSADDLSSDTVKQTLRLNTESAADQGVFGGEGRDSGALRAAPCRCSRVGGSPCLRAYDRNRTMGLASLAWVSACAETGLARDAGATGSRYP